jgi:hypothetical protein
MLSTPLIQILESNNEAQQLEALKELLFDFSIAPNCVERWRWKSNSLSLFTIRSCYSMLIESHVGKALDANVLVAIKKLWRNDVPSKIHVFGWCLLLERLPMRSALNHRGILTNAHELPLVQKSLFRSVSCVA